MPAAHQLIKDVPGATTTTPPSGKKRSRAARKAARAAAETGGTISAASGEQGTCAGEATTVSSVWLHKRIRSRRLPNLSGHDAEGEAGYDSRKATVTGRTMRHCTGS